MKYLILLVIGVCVSGYAISQPLTSAQTDFLKKNARPILQDKLQATPNWSPLAPHIRGKKIILIGEPNHGSKEIFELRNSLIQYLHREMNVNAIVFESGIGEIFSAELNRDVLTPIEMTYGLVGVWRTNEFTELMSYVKAESISIAGFDVQRSGTSFDQVLKAVAQKYNLDTVDTYNLESRYGVMARELPNRRAVYDSLKQRTTLLIQDYKKVNEKLADLITRDKSKDLLFANITIENRVHYLSYMLTFLKDKNWNNRWAARDSAMANNVRWLIDNVYHDQPVIIVGHNFHVGRFNQNETVMGELLAARYEKEMYSIGVFAGSGSYSDNAGKAVVMVPPDSSALDVKHIISGLKGAANFMDIPDKLPGGGEWLGQEIIVNDSFIDLANTNKMIMSRTFDGLIFVKEVTPSKLN